MRPRLTNLFLFVGVFVCAFGQRSQDRFTKEIAVIEEFVKNRMASEKAPGVFVAFMKDDFVWAKGFGFADIENKVPATEHSSFRLASVTKSMTATAVLQLVEHGKINLDAEVQTYVPYFPRKKNPVTVRQLLGHLAGISHYKDEAKELHIKGEKTTKEAIAIFQDFDLIAEPGTRYSYSSYGYNLLGAVVEGASGLNYGDYMRTYVWDPAAMSETRMDSPRDIIPNRVRGYELADGKVRNSEFVDMSSRFAAGGTRSTVLDLLKFVTSLNNGKLLADTSRQIMFESMVTKAGRFTGYGMGWQTESNMGRLTVYHSGGQQETRTALYNFPSLKFTVAVGCNFESSNPFAYADAVVREVLKQPTSIPSYTSDKSLDAMRRGLYNVAAFTAKDLDAYGQRTPAVELELVAAFKYFNTWMNKATIDTAYDAATRRIIEGRHPAAGKAFVKAGAFMAGTISRAYGKERLNSYYTQGGFPFYSDYIQAYKKDASIPEALRFLPAFEAMAERWNKDWQKTWTPQIRALTVTDKSDFDVFGKLLKATFKDAEVYPSLTDGFVEAVRTLAMRGDKDKALKAGALATELYPSSDATNCTYGIALTLFGDPGTGESYLAKAVKLNPNGMARPGSLNDIAYALSGAGNTDGGLAVLSATVKLHPKEANLYDSMGELYAKKGLKEKAVESYKKALEIDPNIESSKKALLELVK